MPGEKHGEFLYIHWSDDYPPAEYVRGHIAHDEAVAEVCANGGYSPDSFVSSEHCWARWTPDPTRQHDSFFRESPPGRGAFAVTRVERR